jgi:hypothetical protein
MVPSSSCRICSVVTAFIAVSVSNAFPKINDTAVRLLLPQAESDNTRQMRVFRRYHRPKQAKTKPIPAKRSQVTK